MLKGTIMLKERRKNHRFPVTEQLSVRFNDECLDGTECSDISKGGMCICFNDSVNTDSRYGTLMLVQKFDDEVIFFESKFVRLWDTLVYLDKKDTRMGIKFMDIDSENIDNLNKILSLQKSVNASN